MPSGAEPEKAWECGRSAVWLTYRHRPAAGCMSFAGKVVCITGASSGIGRALAAAFARQGARVGVLARREDRLRQLCEEIRAEGGTAEFAVADASDRAATRDALCSLSARLGPCDILI